MSSQSHSFFTVNLGESAVSIREDCFLFYKIFSRQINNGHVRTAYAAAIKGISKPWDSGSIDEIYEEVVELEKFGEDTLAVLHNPEKVAKLRLNTC